jgi:hypothetical protein
LIANAAGGFSACRFLGISPLTPGVMTQPEQHRHAEPKARGGCLKASGGHGRRLRVMWSGSTKCCRS